ncbi:cytochrome P450 [Flagelloscypha sp. PMI_526]|nr:cytochrome P450 [Flagelloscypha sp. PMI_526]
MGPILAVTLTCLLYIIARRFRHTSSIAAPIRKIRGLTSWNLLFGNTSVLSSLESLRLFDECGDTYSIDSVLGNKLLITRDVKAIQFLTSHPDLHEKPASGHILLKRLLGEGVLVVEHDIHRRQRRVLNPAFGPAQIRELTELFNSESLQLRDELLSATKSREIVNIVPYLAKCTMQIIGLGGFDFNFRSQSDGRLANSLDQLFKQAGETDLIAIGMLLAIFPLLQHIPTPQTNLIKSAKREMDRIGMNLIKKTKQELEILATNGKDVSIDKSTFSKRDILSLLIRANMANDLPDSQRLSDDEVIAQIPTFIVAGSETTSTSAAWVIFELCKHPEIQEKLRKELDTLTTDNPSVDELNRLDYLGHVVRETLRLHSPVPRTARVATSDQVLPLSCPIRDRSGNVLHEISIKKGQEIYIHILGVNTNPNIWGDDAHLFRPERWESELPEAVHGIPAAWGNVLTFLGGHRACIGFRFSVIELKAILVPLVKAFSFELAVPHEIIYAAGDVVARPSIKRYGKNQLNTLPVILRPRFPSE